MKIRGSFRRFLVCMPVVVLSLATARSAETTSDSRYNSAYEWQTGSGALLCRSYSALKESEAALHALDPNWLQQIGCEFAEPGLRVVLIDAADILGPTVSVWYGRVYPRNGAAPFNAYFLQIAVVTYASYGPFKSELAARRETAPLIEKLRLLGASVSPTASLLPYQITGGPGTFMVRIGPGEYKGVAVFCLYVRVRSQEGHAVPPCKVIGTFPSWGLRQH
jgi:hypothetical protein